MMNLWGFYMADKIKDFVLKSELKNVIENKHFIQQGDEMYCVRDICKGCRYENTCDNTEEDLKLQSFLNLSTRENIKVGKPSQEEWYLPEITSQKDLEYVTLSNGRYHPDNIKALPKRLKALLVLSDSKNTVYKKVSEIKRIEVSTLPFILYFPEEEFYYCLKDSCLKCEYNKDCTNEIYIAPKEDLFVAIDSASQEPTVITFLSNEPNYIRIFANNSIKDISYLIEPLELYFKYQKGMNIEDNEYYLSFVDFFAFEDKTNLLNFSSATYTYIHSKTKESLSKLEKEVKILEDKYLEFSGLVKNGKIKIEEVFK